MTAPARLVLVGHGSEDPQAAQYLQVLRDGVASQLPAVEVILAWIERSRPLVSELKVEGDPGAVVVPLLLSRGTHVERDLPRGARPPLGPDPLLTRVLLDRIAQAGIPAGRPLVLAATGSADPSGKADVEAQADLLQRAWKAPVVVGYATGRPSVKEAVANLGRRSGQPPAVVSYFLAPGRLPSSVKPETDHLATHPALIELVLARYRGAAPHGVTRMGL